MARKQRRLIIIDQQTQTFTLYRVVKEYSGTIQHPRVLPQVESICVYRGDIVLRTPAPDAQPTNGHKPPASGSAKPGPKLNPQSKRQQKRALAPEHDVLLIRAWHTYREGREGMPGNTLSRNHARKLVNHGLLECFTPVDGYMEWYRITADGITHAESIQERSL